MTFKSPKHYSKTVKFRRTQCESVEFNGVGILWEFLGNLGGMPGFRGFLGDLGWFGAIRGVAQIVAAQGVALPFPCVAGESRYTA